MTEHGPARMAAGAAQVATMFFAVGTPEDPNAPRLATMEDWKRCALHPIHPAERLEGQTKTANFAHNWTDGARVATIYVPLVLLAIWGLLWLLTLAGA